MIRLFHVYYPARTVVLIGGEALIVGLSFMTAAMLLFGPDFYLVLTYENGIVKILTITCAVLLLSYYLDLYAPTQVSRAETYFRIFTVVGILSICLGATVYLRPDFTLRAGHYSFAILILLFSLVGWRAFYGWIVHTRIFRDRVFVLGTGDRARQLVEAIRSRPDLGLDVIGWDSTRISEESTQESMALSLRNLQKNGNVHRVVVAMGDRRGTMPLRELLGLRLGGVYVEDASVLLEKTSGKLDVDHLTPSSLIFTDGFRLKHRNLIFHRIVSFVLSSLALLICLPLIPFIALAIRISSPGPILFRQPRTGFRGTVFTVYKFRTMRRDAESSTGAVWATKNDPRVTRLGRFMRKTRLDEIPQLWNVLRGDMGLIGPRPERPEFTSWLSEQIPYYDLRHIVRPGLTGWAQVRYRYGSSLADSKEKLQYDLYYIKHMSISLDLLIAFETIKTVLCRRGAY
ncbi:TIGR03013 family PEP-CTERM/XrtA system glycosyltransferase [Acidobacteria bacterium AB60]|nr:TIGR03013 family PEP-CTERM/XrtA system glycosyltransferase [Acidobacteria bacterium AB60]